MSHTCQSHAKDSDVITITKSVETDDNKIAMCASLELATCRAENWQLKKKLIEYEATIKNLEQLVSAIAEKQHQILSEVVELRKESRASPEVSPVVQQDLSDGSSGLNDSFQRDEEDEEDGYKADSDSAGSHCSTTRSAMSLLSFSLVFSPSSSVATSEAGSESEVDRDGIFQLHPDQEADHSEGEMEQDEVPPLLCPPLSPLHYTSDVDSEGL